MRPFRTDLHRQKYTNMAVRIAAAMIERDYRYINPDAYSYPPAGAMALAERHRYLFPSLYHALVYVAKGLASGHRLDYIRDANVSMDPRALHKRRVR